MEQYDARPSFYKSSWARYTYEKETQKVSMIGRKWDLEEKKDFLSYSAATLENLANSPDPDVPLMALVTELIPDLCNVTYE